MLKRLFSGYMDGFTTEQTDYTVITMCRKWARNHALRVKMYNLYQQSALNDTMISILIVLFLYIYCVLK